MNKLNKKTKGLISLILFLICFGTCYLTYTSSEYIENLPAFIYSFIICISGVLGIWTTYNTFKTVKSDEN